jgi:hypothetical protein
MASAHEDKEFAMGQLATAGCLGMAASTGYGAWLRNETRSYT